MSAQASVQDGPRGGLSSDCPTIPPNRSLTVRAGDGTRLHAEVFGPEDGYPIVLAHGITCAIRVWAYQINDLARDYRVIAYDHRGHGRSGVHASRQLRPQLPGRRPRRRSGGDAGPGRACGHRGPLDGRHRDHVVVGALSPAGDRARRRRRPDQHHHRRSAAARQVGAGAADADRREGAHRRRCC